MKPSRTNGQRMNQLVAPTRRMISTSRRRAKMDSRTVVLMSSTAAAAKMPVVTHMPFSMRLMVPSILRTVSLAYFTPLCVPGSLSTVGSLKNCLRDGVDLVGVLHLDLVGRRQRVDGQVGDDALAEALAEAAQRLVLADVLVALDVGHALDLALQRLRLLGGGVVLDEDLDHDAVLEARGALVEVVARDEDGAEDGRGDEHRDHGRHGHDPVAAHGPEGFAEGRS